MLDAGAAHVVWIAEPVPHPLWLGLGQTQEDPARHDVLVSAMHGIAAGDPRVSVVDLRSWMDAEGLTDQHDLRPDGVHWSPEASVRIATDFLGPAVVRAAIADTALP